ncbi:PfkB family carbohydrate kinase [Desulfogranum mediterraneum]|uniref:PfkB family carbohydrate kinase n=1 Tax=Desulfogranum mediterraneum TaxID=160661 RepID=UPI0004129E35|nr:PfkB family carbohydrate kinase [Desulfogranum mediterraneum]
MHHGVFFGLATLDIIHYVPRFPGINEKLKSERLLSYAGGPATNAAIAFASFGNPCSLISGLGNHTASQYVREEINRFGVNLKDYTDQPDRPPVIASIIVDLSSGSRTVVYANTDARRLRRKAAHQSLLEDADILLLDGHYIRRAVEMAARARSMGIPTVLDGGSWKEGEEELLPFIDYAICSADFSPPGCSNQEEVIQLLRDSGIEKIALTRGAEPILIQEGEERSELPIMAVKPLDTLGAGDILHGAFCHYILDHDFAFSLARASELATLSCTSLGTRAWIEQEKFI